MLFSSPFAVVASLAAVAYASPTCAAPPPPGGDPPTYTLPSTGATDLPNPPSNATLVKIAVGHGLQNYTCANGSATVSATGALAFLYDVTAAYPGTPGSGLSQEAWDNLTSTVVWTVNLPLNLQDPAAASPGTPTKPNVLPEASYGAVVASPFPPGSPLNLGPGGPPHPRLSRRAPPAPPAPGGGPAGSYPYLGVHYFDATSTPTFDLSAVGKFLSSAKTGDVKAPATADKGILSTGAVDWLQLHDNGRGLTKGLSLVYRVITAGGAAEACSVSGAGPGSVPYSAFYWFFE